MLAADFDLHVMICCEINAINLKKIINIHDINNHLAYKEIGY